MKYFWERKNDILLLYLQPAKILPQPSKSSRNLPVLVYQNKR
jgi:hypothetical protein